MTAEKDGSMASYSWRLVRYEKQGVRKNRSGSINLHDESKPLPDRSQECKRNKA